MDFDVLSSSVHCSRSTGQPELISVGFRVAPHEFDKITFSDGHVLAASGAINADKESEPVGATIVITTDRTELDHLNFEEGFCGYAGYGGGRLSIALVVSETTLSEFLRLRIEKPGTAKFYVAIEGLDFGWEPDGSHQTWDTGERYRPVRSYTFSFETFFAPERAVRDEGYKRQELELANSYEAGDRKLAADLVADRPPDLHKLLRDCRWLLLVILLANLAAVFHLYK